MIEDEMSWAGASWARSLELAEQEYKQWLPKPKEEDGKTERLES